MSEQNILASVGTKEIFTALCKAQASFHHAVKDSKNPHFKSSYASLESVLDACKPHLNANGIVLIQSPSANGKIVTVTTILAHESGEYIQGILTLTAVQETPQAVGSAITYARRYSLASLMGLGQEDDDGNAATARPKEKEIYKGTPEQKKVLSDKMTALKLSTDIMKDVHASLLGQEFDKADVVIDLIVKGYEALK